MNRPFPTRGFTVMETLLAAALGAMVMLGVLAVFAAMDRTDSAAARRFDETAMMTRLHVVMERVWSDLLIQDENTVSPTPATGRNTARSTTFAAADQASNGEAALAARPRIDLNTDQSPDLRPQMSRAGMDVGAAPQRLEVVLAHPPVPTGYGSVYAPELQAQLTALGAMASRGVFELRPDAATPAERLDPGEKVNTSGQGWTLWYRSLPPQVGSVQPDPYTLDPTLDPSAVRLAAGLQQCNWQVYKTQYDANNKPMGREKLPSLVSHKLQDLPAYVEMKITTASGLYANWMFEVGWAFGPETLDEAAESGVASTDANGTGGGRTTAGSGLSVEVGPGGGPDADGNMREIRRERAGMEGGRNPGGRNPGGRNRGGRGGNSTGGPRSPGGGGGGRDGP